MLTTHPCFGRPSHSGPDRTGYLFTLSAPHMRAQRAGPVPFYSCSGPIFIDHSKPDSTGSNHPSSPPLLTPHPSSPSASLSPSPCPPPSASSPTRPPVRASPQSTARLLLCTAGQSPCYRSPASAFPSSRPGCRNCGPVRRRGIERAGLCLRGRGGRVPILMRRGWMRAGIAGPRGRGAIGIGWWRGRTGRES
jgi:hypothetical protein